MKVNTIDGNEIDTNNVRDYYAIQLEKYNEMVEWCKENKVFAWAFTLDSEKNCSGFCNYQFENEDEYKNFFLNLGVKIKKMTNGDFFLCCTTNEGKIVII